jgi:hypothetical protein
MNVKSLLKTQLAVAALVTIAVSLFLIIYFALGDNTPAAARLISALVTPPLMIGIVVGGYFLTKSR